MLKWPCGARAQYAQTTSRGARRRKSPRRRTSSCSRCKQTCGLLVSVPAHAVQRPSKAWWNTCDVLRQALPSCSSAGQFETAHMSLNQLSARSLMPVNSGDAMPVNMASRPRARVQGIYLIPVGRARVGLGSRAFILFLWVGLSLGYGPLACSCSYGRPSWTAWACASSLRLTPRSAAARRPLESRHPNRAHLLTRMLTTEFYMHRLHGSWLAAHELYMHRLHGSWLAAHELCHTLYRTRRDR